MHLKSLIYVSAISLLFTSCGVPQADFDTIKAENELLKKELDELKHGADRAIAMVEKAYQEKDYTLAREQIKLLSERHPESPKNTDFKTLLVKIDKEELIENKRKEEAEKERIRLENLNNTGIWEVGYYVDDFGEPTKDAYIKNKDILFGVFSNSATQNSDLAVKFLISNSSDISIQLYEYARPNPVKAYSSDSYTVLIQDKDSKRLELRAVNYSDRLSFDKSNSKKLHKVLMKGGLIKFKIVENDNNTTHYSFTIQNADWYDNAYAKMVKS
jgi:hypothetical protein